MTDRNPPHPRRVSIPDHLWQLFEEMALQMGTDRDGLVCQSMFMFARLNGFLDAPGRHRTPTGPSASLDGVAPAVTGPASLGFGREPAGSAEPTGPMPSTAAMPGASRADTAAQDTPLPDRGGGEDGGEAARGELYVITESGDLDRVVKPRFVIGRGKHCDFIIHSGKVSREHAVVVREDDTWFIEDLGSSNGTWFNKQRVKRRQVEDGDEYYICNEKIKFVLR
jgi:hypothetical protein